MLAVSLAGALLFFAGVVYLAAAAINRGSPDDSAGPTLEPRQRGVGFLDWRANWPGLLLMALGALLLLLPAL
jgi:hypothetical protein